MKFLALVSGGKDSCMNILHCIQQGHELAALVNLHPKPAAPEEIDSYMFQTVGSRAISDLATCLNKPLYRAVISDDENDVVATLVEVFKRVLADLPDIEAVSVGAIGSVYQQLRVDTACQQAGLTSLSFLWQRDQIELLDEIIASGLDARIIKVAGIGLDESHLGKSLAECRPYLLKLHRMYGLHPCGEGGEYETMVFDGPIFERRLVMTDAQVVQHANDDVFYLSFGTTTEAKETTKFELPRPELLTEPFSTALPVGTPTYPAAARWAAEPWHAELVTETTFQYTVAGDTEFAFAKLAEFFERFSLAECRHVSVLVADMQAFASMNKRYVKLFNVLNPPSRACIEAPIQFDVELTVFGVRPADPASKCLHVQGRSFWAPANIGPYSQSRMEYGIDFVAGQIGLVPATLALVEDPATQALLALQNAFRVLDTMHGQNNWRLVSATVFITDEVYHALANSIWADLGDGPLLAVQICALPRGAVVEWVLQALDSPYMEYQSTTDETDEFVWPPAADGTALSFGLHTMRLDPLAALRPAQYTTIYTTDPDSAPRTCQVIPALKIWFNDEPRDAVVQTLA